MVIDWEYFSFEETSAFDDQACHEWKSPCPKASSMSQGDASWTFHPLELDKTSFHLSITGPEDGTLRSINERKEWRTEIEKIGETEWFLKIFPQQKLQIKQASVMSSQ